MSKEEQEQCIEDDLDHNGIDHDKHNFCINMQEMVKEAEKEMEQYKDYLEWLNEEVVPKIQILNNVLPNNQHNDTILSLSVTPLYHWKNEQKGKQEMITEPQSEYLTKLAEENKQRFFSWVNTKLDKKHQIGSKEEIIQRLSKYQASICIKYMLGEIDLEGNATGL